MSTSLTCLVPYIMSDKLMFNLINQSNIILVQLLQSINIIFIITILYFNLINRNKFTQSNNLKVTSRVTTLLILWILMSLPVNSLFLVKLNILINTQSKLIILNLILIIINSLILLVYFNFINYNNLTNRIIEVVFLYRNLLMKYMIIYINIFYFYIIIFLL